MSNPPPIAFTIPYVAVAVRVVVSSNGVLPDGTNPGTPDLTSALVITTLVGGAFHAAAVDPSDNRRVIVSAIAPPIAANSIQQWSFKISVPSKPTFVTVSGTTPCPTDSSGVSWDGVPVGPA